MKRSALLLALCLTGCATTIESTWRSPELKERKIKTFAVFGKARQPSGRIAFEEALTDGLKARGLFAIPGYSFVSFDEKLEKEQIIERLKAKNVDAVLVSRIVGRDIKAQSSPVWVGATVADPFYGGWYGYYGMAPMGAVGSYTTESVEYTVETVLYDLEDNKPMWAARSTTTRKSPTDFGQDIAGTVADELLQSGLAQRK